MPEQIEGRLCFEQREDMGWIALHEATTCFAYVPVDSKAYRDKPDRLVDFVTASTGRIMRKGAP